MHIEISFLKSVSHLFGFSLVAANRLFYAWRLVADPPLNTMHSALGDKLHIMRCHDPASPSRSAYLKLHIHQRRCLTKQEKSENGPEQPCRLRSRSPWLGFGTIPNQAGAPLFKAPLIQTPPRQPYQPSQGLYHASGRQGVGRPAT